MRLQHSRSSALYRDRLQAATLESIVFAFRKFRLTACTSCHRSWCRQRHQRGQWLERRGCWGKGQLQQVRAVHVSRLFSPCYWELDRDIFMSADRRAKSCQIIDCSEFVTE